MKYRQPKSETIGGFLNTMKEPYASKAKMYICKEKGELCLFRPETSIQLALTHFDWDLTDEGSSYWKTVFDKFHTYPDKAYELYVKKSTAVVLPEWAKRRDTIEYKLKRLFGLSYEMSIEVGMLTANPLITNKAFCVAHKTSRAGSSIQGTYSYAKRSSKEDYGVVEVEGVRVIFRLLTVTTNEQIKESYETYKKNIED